MSFWDIFKEEPKTDKELFAEFDALCMRIVAEQTPYSSSMDRYERLLKEIYQRGLEPRQTIVPKNNPHHRVI